MYLQPYPSLTRWVNLDFGRVNHLFRRVNHLSKRVKHVLGRVKLFFVRVKRVFERVNFVLPIQNCIQPIQADLHQGQRSVIKEEARMEDGHSAKPSPQPKKGTVGPRPSPRERDMPRAKQEDWIEGLRGRSRIFENQANPSAIGHNPHCVVINTSVGLDSLADAKRRLRGFCA